MQRLGDPAAARTRRLEAWRDEDVHLGAPRATSTCKWGSNHVIN
jgi:hypothetical protein